MSGMEAMTLMPVKDLSRIPGAYINLHPYADLQSTWSKGRKGWRTK
ncbi:hypothetical protein PT974_07635 [Cladobotryum mycophilum]|uniref:Uncharacterized protein n=1 Tax=Cladobotryum mycophilum TaxID=491253 RepID=A0ABR0SPU8_9HYPO